MEDIPSSVSDNDRTPDWPVWGEGMERLCDNSASASPAPNVREELGFPSDRAPRHRSDQLIG